MKLSDKDIDGFRNTDLPTNTKRKFKDFKEYSNDSDYQTDTSTEYDDGEENDEIDAEYWDEDRDEDGDVDDEEEKIYQTVSTEVEW